MGRSILEVYTNVNLTLTAALDAALESSIQHGIRLIEDIVSLRAKFEAATKAKKRKRQFESLRSMVGLLKDIDNGGYHDFMSELSALEASNKHGTFEWIESVLCRALQEGSWLLIDNVNLCSASVLDRLNALFEHGGKLTVSERGVLDGLTPQITPHPDFRVFLLYDPGRGDISRAMRNRGVEIYIPDGGTITLSSDRTGLAVSGLGMGSASASAMSQVRLLYLFFQT